MDIRIIKPIPAAGILAVPTQAVIYMQDGQAVIDYMAEVPAASTTDPVILKAAGNDALMVSAYDGQKMVYAKAPPADFVFVHEFAGTEVLGERDAPVVTISPIADPLNPVVVPPIVKG